ncbi:helix-turn-helix domain-containing protein [Chryseobacterium sp.]|uniref:helix-turn-helix domain-containing protein n=1 Tax=Chryseobacterium sp. TaxID=1871047 RepID=UPI003219E958
MDLQIPKLKSIASEKTTTPHYKKIFWDIITKKHPNKKEKCEKILQKDSFSTLDILELNRIIFDTDTSESETHNQRYRSFNKHDILHILNFQRENNLNNSELANHFKLSRNTVTKWKKMFQI